MIAFFNDLVNLTPIQHLIKYWWIWSLFVIVLFDLLYLVNKKNPK